MSPIDELDQVLLRASEVFDLGFSRFVRELKGVWVRFVENANTGSTRLVICLELELTFFRPDFTPKFLWHSPRR